MAARYFAFEAWIPVKPGMTTFRPGTRTVPAIHNLISYSTVTGA
jgi:hypothetical protein